MERAKRLELLERPQGSWNRAVGSTWNARSAWTARKAILRSLYCLLAGDIISVLFSSGTPEAQLFQSLRPWNGLRPAVYSNPASSSELPPPCEPEPPPEGVCEPEPESLPLPEPPVCEPPEVEPPLLAEPSARAAEAALLGLRKTVLVPP